MTVRSTVRSMLVSAALLGASVVQAAEPFQLEEASIDSIHERDSLRRDDLQTSRRGLHRACACLQRHVLEARDDGWRQSRKPCPAPFARERR